jgi:hypothetical protein
MKPSNSHPKKSPSSKVRKVGTARCAVRSPQRGDRTHSGGASVPASRSLRRATIPKTRLVRSLAPPAAAGRSDTAALRKEARAWWHTELPTQLERDTLLVPEWIAESVVQEVERFLGADLPADFTAHLAAKAEYLYPRHAQFKKMLNRPGNAGRNSLYMYMRHWTASWLKRERFALYKKLPRSFGLGQALPALKKWFS